MVDPERVSCFLPTAGAVDDAESLLEDRRLRVWVREQMESQMARVGETWETESHRTDD